MNPPQIQAGALTRRAFLRTATAATAVVSAGALDLARSAHAAGSDVLRVGMIGCGGRCTGAAEEALNADPGARLTAMCDIFLERAHEKRKHLKERKGEQVQVDDEHCFAGFDGYQRVIENCDVTLIANAAKFHPLHVKAAIAAGRHVFVEKPHGIDPAGVKLLSEACALAQAKKLCVVSGLQSRYHPGYIEAVQRIHDGDIGDVLAIEENFLRAPYNVINRRAGLSEVEWQCGAQYHFHWLSGDDVVQSLVHNMDRASWVLGDTAPVKAHGLGGRSSSFDPVYGSVFDHHSVIYEWANGARVYAFCRTQNNCYEEVSSLVFGTKGKASLLQGQITGAKPWKWNGKGNPYQIEHDQLFAAIRSGNPINNGAYMARSTLIVIMGQISCYTGKDVAWEDISKSNFYYAPKPEDCRMDMEPPVKPGPDGAYPVYVPGQTVLI
jgi:myo-inositol 2-dehydrogenase / D-chiro-inositol 1-dehydrogenase